MVDEVKDTDRIRLLFCRGLADVLPVEIAREGPDLGIHSHS
jgi:hypothetical protein